MKTKMVIFALGCLIGGCSSYKVPMVPSYQQIPVIQVKKDDTLYSLAKRYDTTVQELAEKNNIADPTALQPGQALTLPKPVRVPTFYAEQMAAEQAGQGKAAQTAVNKPVKADLKRADRAAADSKSGTVKTARAKAGTDRAVTDAKAAVQAGSAPKTYPKPKEKMKKLDKPFVATGRVAFAWPLKGKIVSEYGAKGGGVKNDGINIAAPKGTAVKAAEAGVVVYAGNELKGYGNLLLIRHEKGFMSAYAHADKLYVETGQVVAKGDKIASVGTTGNVKTPQLHFEIRLKTKSVNPKKYLQ